MQDPVPITVVIPTRRRHGYLEATLSSLTPQARAAGAEVLVVLDGPDPAAAQIAARRGAGVVTLPVTAGLNAARNAGARAARGGLIAYLDDDVEIQAGWLEALLAGAAGAPEVGVFGGPIWPRLEGGPRGCGREPAPITSLDLGPSDRDAERVWGANMVIRGAAFERAGAFEESLHGRGDEEEWLERHRAAGGRVRYLAGAAVVHRRAGADARLPALCRAAYALGRSARANDRRKRLAPPLRGELRVLAGCTWHTAARRCPFGVVMAAHAAGRLREALAPAPPAPPAPAQPRPDFLSGDSGNVAGVRASTRAVLADAAAGARDALTLRGPRLRRAAAALPRRRVLALAIERTDRPNVLAAGLQELRRSRHELSVVTAPAGGGGKFEHLSRLLAAHPPDGFDWLLLLDDDVVLPRDFLDRFLLLAEHFQLRIAQPAHRRRSHAAWEVTRRRGGTLVRQTAFVEIGPVSAFHASTFEALLPFPPLRFGWGLDAHWSSLAQERGWRIGVVDATPIRHDLRPVAAAYAREEAVAEAQAFLDGRAYLTARQAQVTLAAHRRLPR
jgi:GT2 family glycosyltransferase